MHVRPKASPASVLVEIESVTELGGPVVAEGTVTAGGIAVVKGWCVDGASHVPADEIIVAVGDGPAVSGIVGFARDDVAARFDDPDARRSGFVAVVPVDVPVGLQPLRITARAGGESIRLDDEYGVDVVPQSDPFDGLPERRGGWLFGLDGIRLGDGAPAVRDADDWILEPGTTGRIALWALDIVAEGPVCGVVARAGGTYFRSFGGIETPDVAAMTGIAGAERAGFHIPVIAPLVGTESIRLFALAADERAYGELCTVRVRLRDPLRSDAVPCRGEALGAIDRIAVAGIPADHTGPVGVPRGAVVTMTGWAVDGHGPRLAALVELEIAGAGRFDAEYGMRRLDVAQMLKCPVADCGFAVSVETGGLEPGTYRAVLRVLGARRDSYTELRHVDLVVF